MVGRIGVVLGAMSLLAGPVAGQGLSLTINDVGLGIGDVPRVTGLRLNFRDRALERVSGINATIWTPYQEDSGTVDGLALGIPATGAGRINGLAASVFGAAATRSFTGIGIGGLGLGAGENLTGIMLGGLGAGAGKSIEGIVVGGLGVGAGGRVSGLAAGGLGVGTGGDFSGIGVGGLGLGAGGRFSGIGIGGLGIGASEGIRGVAIGGLGVGSGEGLVGLGVGGLGVGSGGDVIGVTIGGLGVGAGGSITGITIGGIGVGSGGRIHGVTIAGIGIGAPRLDGVAAALAVGAKDAHALVLAPAYFKVLDDGSFSGASVSAVNRVLGDQHGLTIGIVNYARTLDGCQLGLVNISDNGGRLLVLPIVSVRR